MHNCFKILLLSRKKSVKREEFLKNKLKYRQRDYESQQQH